MEEVKKHQLFFESLDVRSRIYISSYGINGQMSIHKTEVEKYTSWLTSNPIFKDVKFKIDSYHEHAFPKKTVKVRDQLVALDMKLDLSQRGEYLSPEDWKKILEEKDEGILLIDVRNEYEWKIGHFKGAYLPKLETFRQFPQFADSLKEDCDPEKQTILMYCTGGIRCELYSALLKQKGFKKVYQLEGGVVNYGQRIGEDHWLGKLFVFDDRLAISLSEKGNEKIISNCIHCGKPSETYYNCANMDCNELFLSCTDCAEKTLGCCQPSCQNSNKLRPHEKTDRPKPFRKWYRYFEKN